MKDSILKKKSAFYAHGNRDVQMKKKVIMAMSGGVDSSVAAAILLEQGYDVIGITLKLWDYDDEKNDGRTCCSIDDVNDARSVTAGLDIPFYVLNFKKEFNDKVIDYFISTYLNGDTPNPCIACNKYIKFDELLNRAKAFGADYIATGHYAQVDYDEDKGRYLLKKSVDTSKDQTYVLYNLTQDQLKRTLFPLGSLDKKSVREMAQKKTFRVANKPDSQEICFVEDDDYARFIRENSDANIREGAFLDKDGNRIGTHKGIIHYTIGQRRGLGISSDRRLYVVSKDLENNTVTLGDLDDTFAQSFIATDLNFISIAEINSPLTAFAKTRYSAREVPCTISPTDGGDVIVTLDTPQKAITSGQAVVFYDGDVVIGGGTIKNIIK